MSISAIQELVQKQALNDELLSHFINTESGSVVLRFESEYWDYKRDWLICRTPLKLRNLRLTSWPFITQGAATSCSESRTTTSF